MLGWGPGLDGWGSLRRPLREVGCKGWKLGTRAWTEVTVVGFLGVGGLRGLLSSGAMPSWVSSTATVGAFPSQWVSALTAHWSHLESVKITNALAPAHTPW